MSDSNKLVGLDSLSSLAKQLKANIKEDLLGDKKLRYVTLDEYEALSDTEKNNNSIVWNIIDADDLILNDFSTQVDWNETDPESPKYILNKPNLDDALLGELDFSTLEFDTTVIVFDSSYVPLSEPDIPDVPTPPEPEVELSSISASYTGGQVEVGTPISSLKNLTVTAWYINDTSEVITNYTITEGNIVEGRNIIEVSYQGKTATFEVTGYIEQVELASISVSYTGGQVKVGTPISSLGNITVKAWYTNLAEASPRNEISGNNTGAYFYSTPSTIASYVGRPINMIKLQPAASGKLSYGYYSATEFEELGFITLEGASDTLVEYRVQEFTLEEGQNFWIFKPAGESGRFRYGTSKAVEGAECRRNLNSSAEPGTNEGEQVGYLPSLGVDLGYTTEEMSEPEQVFDGWYTDFAIKGSPNAQISANQGMLAYTNPNTIALYVGKPINRLRFMTNNSGVVNYGKFKYDSNGVPTEIIPLGTVSSGGYSSEPVEYEIETFTLVEGENFWIFDSVGGGNDAYLRICTGTSTGNSEFNANIKLGSKGNTLHGGGSNLLVDFGFHGTF